MTTFEGHRGPEFLAEPRCLRSAPRTGSHLLRCSLVLVLGTSAGAIGQPLHGPPLDVEYRVNTVTYQNHFGTDPGRVIELAAQGQKLMASSRWNLIQQGVTTDTGCKLFYPVQGHTWVSEETPPSDGNSTTLATTYQCPFGGWHIKIYGQNPLTLTTGADFVVDLQGLLTHEFTHLPYPGNSNHVTGDPDCTFYATTVGTINQQYYCYWDITKFFGGDAINGQPGVSDFTLKTSTSTRWPLPSGTAWTAPAGALQFTPAGGFVSAARTDGNGSIAAWGGLTWSGMPSLQYEYRANQGPLGDFPTSVLRAPTIVNIGNQRLSLVPVLPGNTSGNDQIQLWQAGQSVSSLSSLIGTLSWQGVPVRTRMPVAAHYSAQLQAIVVAVNVYNPEPTSSHCQLGTFGCTGDLGILVVRTDQVTSSATSFIRLPNSGVANRPWKFGTLAPAIVCEDDNLSTTHCEIIMTVLDVNRSLISWTFDIDKTSKSYINGSLRETLLCGYTTGPISVTGQAGHYLLAVRNRAGRIYVTQKSRIGDAWNGFMLLDSIGYTHAGPVIKVNSAQRNFDVLFAP